MSEEQLKAFIAKVQTDTSLQEQLKAASDGDTFVAIAKANGFLITIEDLKIHRQNLSDKELEVTGGGCDIMTHNIFESYFGTCFTVSCPPECEWAVLILYYEQRLLIMKDEMERCEKMRG